MKNNGLYLLSIGCFFFGKKAWDLHKLIKIGISHTILLKNSVFSLG